MPDPPATQPGAVYDGENYVAPLLTAPPGNGLPDGYADTLDQLHQVPVWPGPPPTAKARRRRIRETLPEVGIVTLVLVILGGLLASAVLSTATVAVVDRASHHGAVITKTAGRPAPPPGTGVTPAARPGLVLGSYLAPRTVSAASSRSRMPVPASSLPGAPGTSPAARTARPSSSPAPPPATVTVRTTPPGSPPPSASAATPLPATPPASTPALTTPPPAPTLTTTASPSPAPGRRLTRTGTTD